MGLVGAGALGGGLVLYLPAHAKFLDLKSTCAPNCALSTWSGLDTRESAGVALIAVGGAALAADVVLWVLAARSSRKEPPPDAEARVIPLLPVASGGVTGLAVTGNY